MDWYEQRYRLSGLTPVPRASSKFCQAIQRSAIPTLERMLTYFKEEDVILGLSHVSLCGAARFFIHIPNKLQESVSFLPGRKEYRILSVYCALTVIRFTPSCNAHFLQLS